MNLLCCGVCFFMGKLCNECGLYPKYPAQGLCKKCYFEKIHKKWRESRPPLIPIPDLPDEIWAELKEAPGYMISNMGRLKSLNYYDEPGRHAILKLREARKGSYLKADLDKYNWRPSVHRLVACYFIPNPNNKPMVNHKDGNKQNNIQTNLEWVTRSENAIHARDNLPIRHAKFWKGKTDGIHPTCKPVKQIDRITGEVLNVFPSQRVAAKAVGLKDANNIYQVLKGLRKVTAGFKWEYA